MTVPAERLNAWLDPLRAGLPEITEPDLRRLSRFADTMRALLSEYPVGPEVAAPVRCERLLRIRRELARHGYLDLAVPVRHGGRGRPAVMQALMQFICGYYDVDLRDSTGLGHGRLIATHASPPVRDRWLPRLLAGALPAIAITEPHGGSRVLATTTTATRRRDGTWMVSGTKIWISRLDEAAVFCVFFTDPAGRLSAAVVDARVEGLHRRPIPPVGLAGWTWGELRLEDVRLHRRDVLGRPGEGMALLREHFAGYRPLVAATALGAAAAAHDTVAAHLCRRRAAGVVADLRDNALITLGRAYAQINAALLATFAAQRLGEQGSGRAELWGCAVKAHGVDVAYANTSELTLLVGALGFTADSRLAKARRDLNGLLYADGIHDSLYRAAGRTLTAVAPSVRAAIPLLPRDPAEVNGPGMSHTAGLPLSSAATVPAAAASTQAAIRRASSGDTREATSLASTKAKPANSSG